MRIVFLLLCLLLMKSSCKTLAKLDLVATGVNQVINEYYSKRHEQLDILVVGKNTSELSFLVTQILKVNPVLIPYRLQIVGNDFELNYQLHRSVNSLVRYFRFLSRKFL